MKRCAHRDPHRIVARSPTLSSRLWSSNIRETCAQQGRAIEQVSSSVRVSVRKNPNSVAMALIIFTGKPGWTVIHREKLLTLLTASTFDSIPTKYSFLLKIKRMIRRIGTTQAMLYAICILVLRWKWCKLLAPPPVVMIPDWKSSFQWYDCFLAETHVVDMLASTLFSSSQLFIFLAQFKVYALLSPMGDIIKHGTM